MSNKTYVFIDVSNLIYGARRTGDWKVNYRKLHHYLTKRFLAKKIFFYAGVESLEDNSYLKLEKLGYILRLKRIKKYNKKPIVKNIKCPKCNAYFVKKINRQPEIKANCDVDLTFDAMRFISEYNQMILISGDGDFYPLVFFLKKKKRKVKIIGESTSTAIILKKLMGGDFIDLISIKDLISEAFL